MQRNAKDYRNTFRNARYFLFLFLNCMPKRSNNFIITANLNLTCENLAVAWTVMRKRMDCTLNCYLQLKFQSIVHFELYFCFCRLFSIAILICHGKLIFSIFFFYQLYFQWSCRKYFRFLFSVVVRTSVCCVLKNCFTVELIECRNQFSIRFVITSH